MSQIREKGYNLKDRRNIYKTGLVNEVTAKAGRVWSKKAINVESGHNGSKILLIARVNSRMTGKMFFHFDNTESKNITE